MEAIGEIKSSRNEYSRRDFSYLVKQEAHRLGFHKVGIVSAEALQDEAQKLNQWLARGFYGQMVWMAQDPDKRTDPREIFREARSVVVVALNYFTAYKHEDDPNKGKVSRYAWGDDYH